MPSRSRGGTRPPAGSSPSRTFSSPSRPARSSLPASVAVCTSTPARDSLCCRSSRRRNRSGGDHGGPEVDLLREVPRLTRGGGKKYATSGDWLQKLLRSSEQDET